MGVEDLDLHTMASFGGVQCMGLVCVIRVEVQFSLDVG